DIAARVDQFDAAAAKIVKDIAEAKIAMHDPAIGCARRRDAVSRVLHNGSQRGEWSPVKSPAGVEVNFCLSGILEQAARGLGAVEILMPALGRFGGLILFGKGKKSVAGRQNALPHLRRQRPENEKIIERTEIFIIKPVPRPVLGAAQISRN